jgi:putative ABC transport system permease protein
MIALARKTLAYEWRRFLPVVLAMCFAGVLLIVQAALVLGIFGTAAIYVKASSADIWAGFPGTQSVNYGHAISADVESHLRMDPDVTRVEPYEWVGWRMALQRAGYRQRVGVPVRHLHRDDAMMFARILPADLRAQLREPGAVIVDSADLDTLGVDLQNNRAWINGKAVRVVAAQPGLRGLGGVNVLASLDTARAIAGTDPT